MPQQGEKKSDEKQDTPKKGAVGKVGEGLGDTVGGLSSALGGLVGGLGKTVGGLGKTVGGLTEGLGDAVSGLVGSLLGPLQALKQQANEGDEEAAQAYGQAVDMLHKSAKKGKTDAQKVLSQLGEALDEPPGDEDSGKPH